MDTGWIRLSLHVQGGGREGWAWLGGKTDMLGFACCCEQLRQGKHMLVGNLYFVGNPQPAAAPPLSSEGLIESLPKLDQGRR